MSERALPRSQKETVYERTLTAGRDRRHRRTHVVKVDRVKVGNDYHGEPVWTRYRADKALCGVFTGRVWNGEPAEDVTCPVCRRELAKLGAEAER